VAKIKPAEIVKRSAVLFIRAYQLTLRPLLPSGCRFAPSCSHYAQDAVRAHGLFAGLGLALWRVLRCHPFSSGGWDPVPAADMSLSQGINK
jgi:putative membrane protein insertion efficiency factor